ncbi:BRO-N domain-containing protein [Gluconobacter oxydans]|uniref:BRO-N domain-containing protein n=1 Tax=Gluconobacter oxydans TaxID=442 RepID=UPI0007817E92|nr:BRO family protein [Gluconobacter oxydans]
MPYWNAPNLFNPSNSNADQAAEVFKFTKLDGNTVKIRTVMLNGTVWLVATDVCSALGLSTNSVSMHMRKLNDDEKRTLNRAAGPEDEALLKGFKTSGAVIIAESGLYKLTMRSDKPNARPFQDWVTKVVLPTIRKEGVYIQGEEKVATATNLNELESLQEQMLALMARKETILTAKLLCQGEGPALEKVRNILTFADNLANNTSYRETPPTAVMDELLNTFPLSTFKRRFPLGSHAAGPERPLSDYQDRLRKIGG